MKKRLRKKFHLQDFQEFGFELSLFFNPDFSEDKLNIFIDKFIDEAIEKNGLIFGGGGDTDKWHGFITLNKRGSATEEHIKIIDDWLKLQPEIKEFKLGQLVDAWYD